MDNRNLILAIVLSVVILLGFQLAFPPAPPPEQPETAEQASDSLTPTADRPQAPTAPTPAGTATAVPGAEPSAPGAAPDPAVSAIQTRLQALSRTSRVRIDTPRLHGSISLVGGRIDDLTLADYRETLDPESAEIVLLSPLGAPNPYYVETGWVPGQGTTAPLPGPETTWTADGTMLTPDTPVTLSWDNGEGLTFERTFAVDADYMFAVTETVENAGDASVTLHPYALVARHGTPEVTGFYILHEGLLGVFEEKLEEIDYDDLQEKGVIDKASIGGWIGITDKYWLAAVIPDQQEKIVARFVHRRETNADKYQSDFLGGPVQVGTGASATSTTQAFLGAKEVRVLDDYAAEHKIKNFDLAIDFGWFYFLTKPLFLFLILINDYVGNLGVAILLLTVVIKVVFFPLANKSYRAMSQMKRLQPEMTKLRERFGEDKVRLNQEMMALYKREKVSPASGCLPMLIQIPVFFALYKVLFVTIEMRQAPFFGWIQDLSAPDPTTIFNAFGLIPWQPPEILLIGIWPLIMGVTMYLQQKLNPAPPDPIQAKIFMFLPIIFTFMLARFPAGLVIYWAWNNVLSMAQQWVIMRSVGVTASGATITPSPKSAAAQGNPKAKAAANDEGEDVEIEEPAGESEVSDEAETAPEPAAGSKTTGTSKRAARRRRRR